MGDQIGDNVKVEATEVERKKNEVKPVEHMREKRRGKDEKNKRKDDKRPAEQFLKGLNDVEDKLEVMCKKYSEVIDENRKLQVTMKQYDKKMLILQREKEQFQSERSKAALTRARLESLCRELQKQNKAVKEESLLKIREQEEMRRELSEKFQGGLAQITALMNLNTEKNAKMYEENLEMNKTFKSVYEQFELKEQALLKVHEEMKFNLQIAGAELRKVKLDGTTEKEALLKEKQQLLYKLAEYQVQIRELQATEVSLRSQISMYTDKYDEFQNALTRSNKVYGEFNEEMERMSKKILTLEKETSLWKQRWESSHAVLLEMAAEKQIRDAEIATLSKKLSLLQDLCKAFQHERTSLLAQLKKNKKTESETTGKTGGQENTENKKESSQSSKNNSKVVLEKSKEETCKTKEPKEEVADASVKEAEKSKVKSESKEVERIEAKPTEETTEETNVESEAFPAEKPTPTVDPEERETVEPLKPETPSESTTIAQSETANTENIILDEPTQEKCSLVLNPETKESSTKNQESRVDCVSTREETEASESRVEHSIVESSAELSRLQEEKSNVELSNKDAASGTQQETSQEVSSNMKNLCDEVESLHTETETIIEQLYEAIDSARQETVKDSEGSLKNTVNSIINGEENKHLDNHVEIENETCEKAANERLADDDVDENEYDRCSDISSSITQEPPDGETVPSKSAEILEETTEGTPVAPITRSLSKEQLSGEQSLDVEPSPTITDSTEAKTSKAATVKNGKRKKK